MAGYFEERAEILTEADNINMNLALFLSVAADGKI